MALFLFLLCLLFLFLLLLLLLLLATPPPQALLAALEAAIDEEESTTITAHLALIRNAHADLIAQLEHSIDSQKTPQILFCWLTAP